MFQVPMNNVFKLQQNNLNCYSSFKNQIWSKFEPKISYKKLCLYIINIGFFVTL